MHILLSWFGGLYSRYTCYMEAWCVGEGCPTDGLKMPGPVQPCLYISLCVWKLYWKQAEMKRQSHAVSLDLPLDAAQHQQVGAEKRINSQWQFIAAAFKLLLLKCVTAVRQEVCLQPNFTFVGEFDALLNLLVEKC